jgi:hypothetical protein
MEYFPCSVRVLIRAEHQPGYCGWILDEGGEKRSSDQPFRVCDIPRTKYESTILIQVDTEKSARRDKNENHRGLAVGHHRFCLDVPGHAKFD